MTWLEAVVVVLAAHRITRALAVDEITSTPREALEFRLTHRGKRDSKIAYLITCPHCVGFYVSVGVLLAWHWPWGWQRWALAAWAVAGAQSLLAAVDSKLAE